MLRVGLTGGLGSGKSTAAKMFLAHGAHVLSSDEIGREMMRPGEPVYAAIVARFGPSVVAADKSLDRAALARFAFGAKEQGGGRVEELNDIVHPAVIARQSELVEQIARQDPNAIVVVESALIFETKHGGTGGWHRRFDKIICVKASEELMVKRFVARASRGELQADQRRGLEAEARRRLAKQTEAGRRLAKQTEAGRQESHCDYVLINNGSLEELQAQVDELWSTLREEAERRTI